MDSRPVIVALAATDAVVEFLAGAGVRVVSLPASDQPAEELAADLVAAYGEALAGVVAVSDATVALAATLSSALGTPGPSVASVALAGDKIAMRTRLAESGISTVRWAAVRSETDLRWLVADLGPVIVKPSNGSASRHVFRVDGADDDAVLAEISVALAHEAAWIAEEFLDGPEISVETLSWAGQHHVLAITAKETGPGFVEIGHHVPAELPGEVVDEVGTMVVAVLDALGIDHTVGHTEFILTDQGPRVVETHPRMGGDRIGRLVELVTTRHPLAALATALAGDEFRVLPGTGGAAIRFLSAEPGTVEQIGGDDAAAQDSGVVEVNLAIALGDVVAPLRSSADRCGHVIATAPDAHAATERARAAAARIRIVTGP